MGYQPILTGGQNGAVFMIDADTEEGCETIEFFKPKELFFDPFNK